MVPPKKKTAPLSLRWLLILLIPGIWCIFAHLGWLDVLENETLKLRYLARGEISAPIKVVYVDVDTRAVQELGERPWDRAEFGAAAQVLLEVGKAKAIGFDFVFSDYANSKMVPRAELLKRDVELAKVIRRHPEIVLAAKYSEGAEGRLQEGVRKFPLLRRGFTDRLKNDVPELPQGPIIGPTWGSVGLIDVDYDYGRDQVPRWVPLFAETPNPTFYNLSLKLVLIDLGLDESAVRISSDALTLVRPDGAVAGVIPLRAGQLLEVNWFSRWANPTLNPRTSLADVLLYQRDLKADTAATRDEAQKFFAQFANAIVLIGPVDSMLQDLAPTPFDLTPVPKVGLHGNLIKTIRSGFFLKRVRERTAIVFTFLLTLVVSRLAVVGGAKSFRFKILAGAAVGLYVLLALGMFKNDHTVLPMAAPLGATLSASFLAVGFQLLEEEKQKGRIKGMFGTYLSPRLVDRMVESGEEPRLGGHEEEITAYFSDIQSFSTISEALESGPLVELMNEYLTACTDIVQEEGGTLDKYIGDAVVAMFGAPVTMSDHAYRACIASQRVHKRLGELRAKWKAEGRKWPEIVAQMQSRIGLNSGPMTIGNMGSRTRFNYTMMGDNVNLAARMESGAKAYGVYTMVTESTKVACEQKGGDRLVFRYLDRIVVKGRSQPVPVYEIVGLKEDVTAATQNCLGLFAQGVERYLAQDWDAASRDFIGSAALEPNLPGQTPGVETNPSLVMGKRCEELKRRPPGPNWDGTFVMKSK